MNRTRKLIDKSEKRKRMLANANERKRLLLLMVSACECSSCFCEHVVAGESASANGDEAAAEGSVEASTSKGRVPVDQGCDLACT